MPEERREDDVGLAVVRFPAVAAGPRGPHGGVVRWVRGRAEGEDVEDHRLVVADPGAEGVEPGLRLPAHADPRARGAEPLPVGAEIDRVGERPHLHVERILRREVLPRVEDPGEEERRVDARELAAPRAERGVHGQEVVEEPLVADGPARRGALGSGPECIERGQDPRPAFFPRDVAAVDPGADGGEAEADGRDRARRAARRAVLDEAVGRIGLVPEVVERRLLERVQEHVGGRRLGAGGAGAEPGAGDEQRADECQCWSHDLLVLTLRPLHLRMRTRQNASSKVTRWFEPRYSCVPQP